MMFIGGASGSTAGGIKVNTFSVLLIAIVSTVRGRPSAEALRPADPARDRVPRAVVALLSIAFIFVVALSLELTTPPTIPFVAIVFESISAFATVGASAPASPRSCRRSHGSADRRRCSSGRLGPLTLVLALAARSRASAVPPSRRNDAHRMSHATTHHPEEQLP